MKLKASLMYQASDYKKSLILFYGIMVGITVAIFALILLFDKTAHTEGAIGSNGLDFSSMIYCLICGIAGFRELFQMQLQNGVSRKTMFKSAVLLSAMFALLTSGIDIILFLIGDGLKNVSINGQRIDISSAFSMFYPVYFSGVNAFVKYVVLFIYLLFAHFAMRGIGFFIGSLYSKVSKKTRLLISIGVPVFFIIVLPLLDTFFFNGKTYSTIITMIDTGLGITKQNPWYGVITFLALGAAFHGLSIPFLRRLTIK